MIKKITILSITSLLITGCVYRKEIVRPDDLRMPINFSSERSRDTFNCALEIIERSFPLDKKQENSSSANLLIVPLYKKDYFLSENAYFNYIVEKTDSNKDSIISKEEANALYKSYFPGHKYTELNPGDGLLKRMEASMTAPRCDIHAAP